MVIILGFIVFLLSVYLLSREDFVFMRRNINLEEIFDVAFLNALVALLAGRIFFVAFHLKIDYTNPLVFFLVPYFPGLSISGAILGSFVFLLWISKIKKLPTGHVMDIFAISFLYAFSITLLGYSAFSFISRQFITGIVGSVWGVIALALSILFGSIQLKTVWKDGSMSAVVVATISMVLLITHTLYMFLQKPFILDKELVLLFLILIASGVISIGRKFLQRSKF